MRRSGRAKVKHFGQKGRKFSFLVVISLRPPPHYDNNHDQEYPEAIPSPAWGTEWPLRCFSSYILWHWKVFYVLYNTVGFSSITKWKILSIQNKNVLFLFQTLSAGHFHWPLYSKKPLNPETQSNLRHLAKYKFSSIHTYLWLHIKLRARESFHVLNQGMYTTWRGGVCLEIMRKYTIVCLIVFFLCLKQQKMIPI